MRPGGIRKEKPNSTVKPQNQHNRRRKKTKEHMSRELRSLETSGVLM